MSKGAIIGATIGVVIVYLVARFFAADIPPYTILAYIAAGVIANQVLQQWIVPAIKKYWRK